MHATPLHTSDDGYIRLMLSHLRALPLVHLVSGLDESHPAVPRCGGRTAITGYTEWLGGPQLQVTLGWDWVCDPAGSMPLWRRSGLPRTNILLTDDAGRDVEWRRSLVLLGAVVDTLPWAEHARSAIALRYAA